MANGTLTLLLLISVVYKLEIGLSTDTYFFVQSVSAYIVAVMMVPLRSHCVIFFQTNKQNLGAEMSSWNSLLSLISFMFVATFTIILTFFLTENLNLIVFVLLILGFSIIFDYFGTSLMIATDNLFKVEYLGIFISLPIVSAILLIKNIEPVTVFSLVALRSIALGFIKIYLAISNMPFKIQFKLSGFLDFWQDYYSLILSSIIIKNERFLLQYFSIMNFSGLSTLLGILSLVITGINTLFNKKYGNSFLINLVNKKARLIESRYNLLRASWALIYCSCAIILLLFLISALHGSFMDKHDFLLFAVLSAAAVFGELIFGYLNQLWVYVGNTTNKQTTIAKISVVAAVISMLVKAFGFWSDIDILFFISSSTAFMYCCYCYTQKLVR